MSTNMETPTMASYAPARNFLRTHELRDDMREVLARCINVYSPKTLAKWTGATPRACANWQDAVNGIRLEHLAALSQHMPELRPHVARWFAIEMDLREDLDG